MKRKRILNGNAGNMVSARSSNTNCAMTLEMGDPMAQPSISL